MTQAPPELGRVSVRKPRTSRAEEKLRAFHEEDAIGKAYDARLLSRLWPFVRPHKTLVFASLATLLVLTSMQLVRPLLMGGVVKQASLGDAAGVLRNGVYLAVLMVVFQSMTFLQTYTMQLGGARAMAGLRSNVFAFLQRLPMRYFDRTPVGRLVTRVTGDVDAVGELFASGVFNAMGDLISLAGIMAMMLALDWQLSLIAFAATPVVALLVQLMRERSRRAYRDIRTKTARLNAFINEQVSGIAVVQAFNRERAMAAEFDDINAGYLEANKRAIKYEAVLDAAIEMVSTLCIASMLWYAGANRLTGHPVTFDLVVTFTAYIRQFFEPISMLSQRYTIMQSAMAGGERIFQLLDEPSVETESAGAAAGDTTSDEALAFENVTFSYKPGFAVLRNINLHARRGEKIALVGATGAGKTTIASLALRLYEVDEGVVRVLGRDVRSFERGALREQFSVVPQDVFLFPGTVLSNIALIDEADGESIDRERAEKALEHIGAKELFLSRPGGLDARVDERGSNFSAGERQLLAFARAVYRNAPVLVLDEATASVDSDTEARLQRALEAVMERRTALVIAHRLSTIRAVDRIVVFHKGRVVEAGTHDELIGKDGLYARLYRTQFAEEKKAPA